MLHLSLMLGGPYTLIRIYNTLLYDMEVASDTELDLVYLNAGLHLSS